MPDELDLVTSDGVHLSARRWPGGNQARASVVIVHGMAASASEARVVSLAEALNGAGHDVLAYDSRGHGTSGGECTLGDFERFDVRAAVDNVQGDAKPVIVVGASMGAIGVLRFVVDEPGSVSGVVTVSCPGHWRLPRNARGAISAVFTQTGVGRWFARRQMNVRIARRIHRPEPPIELVARVGIPIAILHGRGDPFIDPTDADDLYAAANNPKRLEIVDGLGHAYEAGAITPVLRAVDWALDARNSSG